MRILLYLSSIILANVLTARFAPLDFGLFIIPVGTLIIGLTFIFRDFVQMKHGRKFTYFIIFTALILSGATSYLLGDTLYIVLASLLAFICSETLDTEIFTRLKESIIKRIFVSSSSSSVLDSVIFAVVGLSPIGSGFLTWEQIPLAIIGQIIGKVSMQIISVSVIKRWVM